MIGLSTPVARPVLSKLSSSIISGIYGSVSAKVEKYGYQLDGFTQNHKFSGRLINIANDINISVRISHAPSIVLYEAIVCQTNETNQALSEFVLKMRDSGTIYITVGGETFAFTSRIPTSNINLLLGISLVGTTLKMYWDGVLVETKSFTRGSVVEPNAVTIVGGVTTGGGGGLLNIKGFISDVVINGVSNSLNNKTYGEYQISENSIGPELSTIPASAYASKPNHYSPIFYFGVNAEPGNYLVSFKNNGNASLWYRLGSFAVVVLQGATFTRAINISSTDSETRNYVGTWNAPWEGTLENASFKKLSSPFSTIVNYNSAGWVLV